MNQRDPVSSLVAPNIFDFYANPNLVLSLVLGNLLSPSLWEWSTKLHRKLLESHQVNDIHPESVIRLIQEQINKNFMHLHLSDVPNLYGELILSEEADRVGDAAVRSVTANTLAYVKKRIETGDFPAETITLVLASIESGRFPAYFYGNADLIRAHRKLSGKKHQSISGLTSCVDECTLLVSLVMTIPKGLIANVVALTGPYHTTAFGWNEDGQCWWFYGKNKLFFKDDWRTLVSNSPHGDAQACFDQLFEDMDHIISVAGIFDLTSGRSNIVGSHVDEIIDKLDGFFGIRLKQIDRGLDMPRQQLPEDPLGDVFRALLGTRSIEVAKSMLLSTEDQHIQQALYSFRTLSVQDLRPYLLAARSQPQCKKLGQSLLSADDAILTVSELRQESIFQDRDRIAMPDETLRLSSGSDRDRALLLHVLIEHCLRSQGISSQVITIMTDESSFVQFQDRCIDGMTCQPVAEPTGHILYRLTDPV